MNLNKQEAVTITSRMSDRCGLVVEVVATFLLVYGLLSWHNFNNAFLAPSSLALAMGLSGAVLIFSVAVGKKHLGGISKFMVILALAGIILLGFSARADLATHDPLGSMWRWVMVTALYLIAMVCSYGAISLPQRHAR